MGRLTLEQIVRENEDQPSSTTSLLITHRALSDVSCLASFPTLEKLDLSFNCLSSLQDLTACVNLKWLSVAENKLEYLKDRMPFEAFDNNISSICKLDQLMYLNTLVLSNNPIYDIGDSLLKVKSLKKLSLSHCHLEKIGSSLTSCVELKELRLAHNKITTISTELTQNVRLQNLDLGKNVIMNWSDLKVLSTLPNLKNLYLQGNSIAEKDKLVKKER